MQERTVPERTAPERTAPERTAPERTAPQHDGDRDQPAALVELEERGWRALSTEGAAGPFYRGVLDREVLMLLPGGLVIDDREQAIASMSGAPWSQYRIEDVRARLLTADTGLVAYAVRARRGAAEYSALVSSIYVRRDGHWRLAVHQQTPR